MADETAHPGARLAGGDEAQPRRLRVLRLGGQDFDLVAILEHRAQRDDAAVDLGADGAVAEPGVDRISEIDRGRALGQLDQLALGGEGEDPVLVHRHPGVLEQLLGALGMVEDLDQIVDPRHVEVGARLAFLIGPVGGEAALGLLVHVLVADLDFDPHLGIVDDRGVQAAVAVALGRRDVILEAARDHRPAPVDQAERAIAVADVADDHAEGHHVGQLLEADVPLGHLLPDRIGMLLAAHDLGFEAVVGKVQLKPEADPADEVAALVVELLQAPGDRGVGVRLELPERERLHLVHHLIHADPLGQRGIDIHRLAGDAAALLLVRDVVERAHVVQPVGELDQQHADVVAEREQEFAQVLGRALILRLRLDLADSLVTPSTSRATSLPNSFSISSGVASVSSIVSWRIAVAMVWSSSLRSVRIPATSIGWLK